MPAGSLDRMAERLRSLVLEAGRRLRRQLEKSHQIRFKGEANLVTEMDTEVESLLIQGIRRTFPDHEVLSEEMDEPVRTVRPPKAGRTRWIIDPLDGTTNYAHGFPHFAVSVGVEVQGRVILGAVYNPMLPELFFARKGHGAERNGKPIRVSSTRRLDRSLLATGFPYDLRHSRDNNFDYFQGLSLRSQAIRRAGAAALDLCDVACGRFDGFWEMKLRPWDVAAGALLVEEAGGRITDFQGQALNIYDGSVAASNGLVHGALLRGLDEVRRGRLRPAAKGGRA